jgi:putative transposase
LSRFPARPTTTGRNAERFEVPVPRYAGGRPAKLTADLRMQKRDSKKLPRMRNNTVLGFFDECSPQTTANTQRMSSFACTLLVKNTTKIRANTFGILAVNGTSIITFREHSKKEDIREVLHEFKQANPGKRLIVVQDNFSSHHAIVVRPYTASNNIQLVHLPPYAPDLNPIEQIWRAIKREVVATFIMNYEHLTTTIAGAFEKLAAKRSYWEKWVTRFLSPRYASKLKRE